MDWKYKIGDVISTGGRNRIVVTGTREDQCPGGVQRFYLVCFIVDSFTAGIGTIVLEEMDKAAAQEKK